MRALLLATSMAMACVGPTAARAQAPSTAADVIARRDASALAGALADVGDDDYFELQDWLYDEPDAVIPVLLAARTDSRDTRMTWRFDGTSEPVRDLAVLLVCEWMRMAIPTDELSPVYERYFRGSGRQRGWLRILEDPAASPALWNAAVEAVTRRDYEGGVLSVSHVEPSPALSRALEERVREVASAGDDFCPLYLRAGGYVRLPMHRTLAERCAATRCTCADDIQARRAMHGDIDVLEDELCRLRTERLEHVDARTELVWSHGDDPRVRSWAREMVRRARHEARVDLWIGRAIYAGGALAVPELRAHAAAALADRRLVLTAVDAGSLYVELPDERGVHVLLPPGMDGDRIRRCDLYAQFVAGGAMRFSDSTPSFELDTSWTQRDAAIAVVARWLAAQREWGSRS